MSADYLVEHFSSSNLVLYIFGLKLIYKGNTFHFAIRLMSGFCFNSHS